jgi:hypothetical protein
MPVNISINTNTVAVQENINYISVNDPNNPNVVDITQPITNVVEVITAGPVGPIGPIANTDSLLTTSSFNSYTGSSTSQFAGTSSYAFTASYLSGYVSPFPYTGSAQITGSLGITGSAILNSNFGYATSSTALVVNNNTLSEQQGGEFVGYGIQAYGRTAIQGTTDTGRGVQGISTDQGIGVAGKGNGVYSIGVLAEGDIGLSAIGDTTAILAIGLVNITGNTQITGSLEVSGSITGSLLGTASYARNAATSSNILGGKATHIPFFKTDTTLATSSLFQSGSTSIIINQDNNTAANPEALYVWQPSTTSFNVISGKGNLNNYLQLNIHNTNQGTNASSDVVATANNGDENGNYIDMGINSQNYSGVVGGPNDAYLYSTGQHLHIGNTTPNMPIQFFVGGTNTDANRKFELNADGKHNITGSLTVSQGITGSLLGNASTATNADNATSASYALVASSTPYAAIAGNGGVTSIIAGSGITLPFGGVGNVTIVSSGGGGVTIISGSVVTASFNNVSSWPFTHSLGTRFATITVFDSNYNQIIPQNISLDTTSSATITFPTLESGFAIASTGGTTDTALSSSYSLFASYASSASYFPETDPIFVSKSGSLATTGSNTFKGSQTITGSFSVTGSTLQTGNNTLIGSTVLSGSISVSGSQTFKGNLDLTGSFTITGSTLQIGNNTLTGNTLLTGSIAMTGSILIFGDVLPQISSSYSLGSLTQPWKSIYVQSGSISIQSDIPGNPPATISNQTGNVTITTAGFQIKSGSTTPFILDTTGRTQIRVPNIPANDVGGLSIIGSSDGTYQPVINPSGMVHITGNDNQAARMTVDGFGSNIGTIFVGRHARGSSSTPTPTLSGDVLVRFAGLGYATSNYFPVVGAVPTSLEFQATENYSTSSYGSRAAFYTYANGATSRSLSATIDSTGIQTSGSVRATSFTGSLFGTSSWAINAQTASYVLQAVSASFSSTASHAPNYVLNSSTGSFATTGSNVFIGNQTITGSLRISGSLTEIGNTTITGSLLITGSTTHNGNISISGSVHISGSIIMDGTAQSLVIRTSATNPSALAIHTFPTASYSGANYNFVVIEDSTKKSTTYNILVAQGNNKVAEIKTYLIKSEASSPVPTIATAINAGNIELRMTDTGTFTYRGIVQLF